MQLLGEWLLHLSVNTRKGETMKATTRPRAARTPERHYLGTQLGTGLVLASEWTDRGELLIVLRAHHFNGCPYSVILDGEGRHFRTLEEAAGYAQL